MADGERIGRRGPLHSMPAPKVFVWGWGAGTDGQLGTGVLEDRHSPQPFRVALPREPPDDDEGCDGSAPAEDSNPSSPQPSASASPRPSLIISRIACGGAHAIALTDNGKVLTWGRGLHGQLGHNNLENCSHPKIVQHLEKLTVSYASAGWNHSGFVTDYGRLFTCGDGSFGQLGHGDYRSCHTPVEVTFVVSKHVEQIECGMRHSLILMKGLLGNSVYSFGYGRHGQLGITLNGNNKYNLPQIIPDLDGGIIRSLSANGDHSAAISVSGQLYIWGRAFGGMLDNYVPHQIQSQLKFFQVALGWNHALLLTDGGKLFMLGGNHHGKLSCSNKVKVEEAVAPYSSHGAPIVPVLKEVPCLAGEKVVHIAAGAEHSALVTEKGEIMTWGWGEHGQLGLGNSLDQVQPQLVKLEEERYGSPSRVRVFCGSGFTIAVKLVYGL